MITKELKPRPKGKTLMEVFNPRPEMHEYRCNVIGYSGDVEGTMSLMATSDGHARSKLVCMGVELYSDLEVVR